MDYMDANPRSFLPVTMGARKTATTIYHSVTRHFNKVIVVCLKDNIKTWCDELDDRFPNEIYTPVIGSTKQKEGLVLSFIESDARFLIVNYDGMKRHTKTNRKVYDAFKTIAPNVNRIIFDESYEISGHTSNRFKDIRRIISPIENRVVMDGEPTAEGIAKLYGQFLICDDGATFGRDNWKFKETYFFQPPSLPFPKWIERKTSAKKIQSILAKRAFVFTEADLREEIGLPEKVPYQLWPEPNKNQKKIYKEIKDDWTLNVDGKSSDLQYTMERLSKMRQVLDGFVYRDGEVERIKSEKERVLKHMLTHQLKHKKKIVIFAAFRESLKIISEVCASVGRESISYYGGLSMSERAFALNAFKGDDSIEVFICQASCGVGLNELVVSNVAVYYSNSEKRRDRAQSEKRQIRPTQKEKQSYVIDLISPETVEQTMWERLGKKESKSMMLLNAGDLK